MFYNFLMKIMKYLFFCLIGLSGSAFAQNTFNIPAGISSQIPKNWVAIDYAQGDINKDKLIDSVIVLQNKDIPDTPRKIMVFILTKDNQYQLFSENDSVALCGECGGMMGDPYQGIEVKPGVLKIYNMGGSSWRWTHHFTFNYSRIDNQLQLVREEQSSFHASDPNKIKNIIKTPKNFGKISLSHFKVEN